jgi:hypothetical protein
VEKVNEGAKSADAATRPGKSLKRLSPYPPVNSKPLRIIIA